MTLQEIEEAMAQASLAGDRTLVVTLREQRDATIQRMVGRAALRRLDRNIERSVAAGDDEEN